MSITYEFLGYEIISSDMLLTSSRINGRKHFTKTPVTKEFVKDIESLKLFAEMVEQKQAFYDLRSNPPQKLKNVV